MYERKKVCRGHCGRGARLTSHAITDDGGGCWNGHMGATRNRTGLARLVLRLGPIIVRLVRIIVRLVGARCRACLGLASAGGVAGLSGAAARYRTGLGAFTSLGFRRARVGCNARVTGGRIGPSLPSSCACARTSRRGTSRASCRNLVGRARIGSAAVKHSGTSADA